MTLTLRTAGVAALGLGMLAAAGGAAARPADRTIGGTFVEADVQGPAGGAEWNELQRTYPHAARDLDALAGRARGQARAVAARSDLRRAAAWQNLGPDKLGGRVPDLVVDPSRPDTVYAGAASGGVWRSTDAGRTFTYAWDRGATQAIGAMAVADDGTLVVGTGEANPGGGSTTVSGSGVYRSTDGGATWTSLGLTGSARIGAVVVDPKNPARIFVAATGGLFSKGGERGVYGTVDGGATWKQLLAGTTPTTGAVELDMSAADPNTLYAAMWDHYRTPQRRVYGGTGSGVYRSTDGGATWTRLGGGLPAASADLGRMGVVSARSDPRRLYVVAMTAEGRFEGMYTSTDGGTAWQRLANTGAVSSAQADYGWWFSKLYVDPKDPRHVLVTGVALVESVDAGASWRSSSTGFHADQHVVVWDPRVPRRAFLGNDGGVYASTDNASLDGRWTKTTSLANMQFYSIAVSQQDPSRISGGLQDNGSVRSWSGWGSHLGGDGLKNLIDPTNHQKIYACSQDGACSRSTDGGNSMQALGATTSARRAWLTPMELDPANPAVVYYGGNVLNRSTNSGAAFTAISKDLSKGGQGGDSRWGTISAIAPARSDGRVIYVGTNDGNLWITRNTGGTWTQINAGLPDRWITQVAVDPATADTAYVTVSGYRSGESAAHVFRTTDGGRTWTPLAGNLPDAPVNDIMIDPVDKRTLHVATDVGVYSSADGRAWTPSGTGLPQVPVADLVTNVVGGRTVLTAGTFGLGVWRLTPTR
ncbi:hypothetical protein GCM10010124_34970 [Pilimelia terevasa]|uniref:Sortilin N-terminal domain-containing protein n=1 Tax=Pilimelia terevasa TaxID=53372 RepID=A0A8J3FLW0_9ACTN|nr:glycosyl hydrolase [Pilimelia terevasa]GGK39143.1 hypothetical protein GCM10010124_34970 [Pilimelia terevasa]